MSLISRYIFREIFGTWAVVIAVLFLILMSNQFAELLAEAAAEKLPREAVLAIFTLTFLRYVALIAPIALFLGVLLALARLNRDSERAALAACGVGPGSMLIPVGVLAALLAGGVGWIALVQTPHATAEIDRIRTEARASVGLGVLEPGKFTMVGAGGAVLYAGEVVGDEIRDVFLQYERGESVVVILAERAQRVQDSRTGQQALVFYGGRRYEGVPGEREFLIVEFEEHGIPVDEELDADDDESPFTKPTRALLASSAPADRAELQWRVSAPVSLLVLALLAVPLSRSSPREGRYARIGIGLLIYICYANALSVARVWIEREQIPPWLGLWWVHAAIGLLAALLLAREAGWIHGRSLPGRAGLQ